MPTYNYTMALTSTNRADIRNEVTTWFLQEIAGTGKGALCSTNIYTVESYNGITISLNRPANLNKGFDFTVNINTINFRTIKTITPIGRVPYTRTKIYAHPSHDDIFNALSQVQRANAVLYNTTIKPLIDDIFNCQNVFLSTTSIASFNDYLGNPHPIEIILLAIKWLFIEQDITYWNWSGRQMLYDELHNHSLV